MKSLKTSFAALLIGLSSFSFACTEEIVLDNVQAIRSYLQMRPYATDTLEGIHNYWLQSNDTLDCTLLSLQLLENSKVVERIRIGRTILWRRKI